MNEDKEDASPGPAIYRVLFLDIEGVLNPHFGVGATTKSGVMCANKLERLKRIHSYTGCKIVLTSQLRQFEEELALYRKDGLHWDELAPITGSGRKADIAAWLEKNPEVERFAVLDDDPEAWEDGPNFVQTKRENGLKDPEMNALIDLLSSN